MANQKRTEAELLRLFRDNNSGRIDAQDIRDLIVSARVDEVKEFLDSGVQGAQGVQGNYGLQGAQGTLGAQGDTGGAQGAQGAQGKQGTAGTAGSQGAQGRQGVQGTAGSQGAHGAQGASGAQGKQGSTGATGFQGNQGANGAQGSQGKTGSGAQGEAGAQGNQGAAGSAGFQGNQGVQGATGNGAQGATGNQGAAGAQGVQGVAGFVGSNGAQGAQGNQGAAGSQGNQGVQGAQGFQGSSGDLLSTWQYTTSSLPATGQFSLLDINDSLSSYFLLRINSTDLQGISRLNSILAFSACANYEVGIFHSSGTHLYYRTVFGENTDPNYAPAANNVSSGVYQFVLYSPISNIQLDPMLIKGDLTNGSTYYIKISNHTAADLPRLDYKYNFDDAIEGTQGASGGNSENFNGGGGGSGGPIGNFGTITLPEKPNRNLISLYASLGERGSGGNGGNGGSASETDEYVAGGNGGSGGEGGAGGDSGDIDISAGIDGRNLIIGKFISGNGGTGENGTDGESASDGDGASGTPGIAGTAGGSIEIYADTCVGSIINGFITASNSTNDSFIGDTNFYFGGTAGILGGRIIGYDDYEYNLTITNNAEGSIAYGYISPGNVFPFDGAITVTGNGSFAIGCVTNGIVAAQGNGSIAFGVTSGNGSISTSNSGCFAGGYSDGQTINANGFGAFAFGCSQPGAITASSSGSVCLGGKNNSSGAYAACIGNSNEASAEASIALGYSAKARVFGEIAYGNLYGSYRNIPMTRTTSNNASSAMVTLDSNTLITMPNDTTWTFEILLTARRVNADNESSGWKLYGVIDRNSGAATTALVGSVTKTLIAQDSSWDCSVTANTSSGGLQLNVTGENSKTIAWQAMVQIMEVTA